MVHFQQFFCRKNHADFPTYCHFMCFNARRVCFIVVELVSDILYIFMFFSTAQTHTALYYEPFLVHHQRPLCYPTTNHCSSSFHRQSFAASSIISSFRAEPTDRLSDLGRQQRRSWETPKTHVSAGVSSHPNRRTKAKQTNRRGRRPLKSVRQRLFRDDGDRE